MKSHNGSVDFSLRVYTEENFFGPAVKVIQSLFNGDIQEEWMPVALAVHTVLCDPGNGLVVKSAHIDFAGVYDEWGQSF
ncbi:MAG TPA: hypothetical protein VMT46_04970 [Anaerolineaceae bacterium]|nr:hypothetical protein [Anaerolineaceae bacterium]